MPSQGFWDKAERVWQFLWWGGRQPPSPTWLLAYGLAMGFIIGVLLSMRFAEVQVIETVRTYIFGEKSLELPKPVTPPPPGYVWAKVLTTGYCPCNICCPGTSDGRTAINRSVNEQPYGIAVEPKILPYRQHLMVPGYGYAMIDDTGGAMRQDAAKGIIHLDLRFAEHTVARHWGRRWMWIAIPADCNAAKIAADQERQPPLPSPPAAPTPKKP